MTSEQKPWNELLKSISLSQFIPKNPPPILEIDEEMNAFEAAEILAAHNYFSAPVKIHDASSSLPCTEKYRGILSPHDLLSCFVKCCQEMKLSVVKEEIDKEGDDGAETSPCPTDDYYNHSLTEIDKMKTYKIKDILGQSSFVYVSSNTSLYDSIQFISSRRAFRLCVVDEKDPSHLLDFISKTKIEQILYPFVKEYPSIANMTLDDLHLTGPADVLTLDETQPTYEAFTLLSIHNIGGLPIVDSVGSLAGSITVKDIYHLLTSQSLYDTLKYPLSKYVQERDFDFGCKSSSNAIICHRTDTVLMLLGTYIHDSTNRVFLIDEYRRPLRCITLFDLLCALVNAF